MLEKINSVKDLKALNIDELKLLDQDIKKVLINKTAYRSPYSLHRNFGTLRNITC